MVRNSRRSDGHRRCGVSSPVARRPLKRNCQKKQEKRQIKRLLEELKDNQKSISDHINILQKEKNIPENLLNCSICCSGYSKKRHLPLVGTCGHTICRQCVKSLRNRHCPICRVENSFKKPAKNFSFYDLLDQMDKLSPAEEAEDDVESENLQENEEISDEDEELSEESEEEDGEVLYIINPDHEEVEEEDDDEEEESDDDDDENDSDDDEMEDEEESLARRADVSYFITEEIRNEINAEFRGQEFREPRFLAKIACRIDYLWFLVYSYTLHGVSPARLAELRRKIHPNTPYYKDLQYGAKVLLQWKLQQDRDAYLRTKLKLDKVHWKIDEDVAEREAGNYNGTDLNSRLLEIYRLSDPFEPNSGSRTENEQRILNEVSILHVIQYNEQKNNSTGRLETPPRISQLFSL